MQSSNHPDVLVIVYELRPSLSPKVTVWSERPDHSPAPSKMAQIYGSERYPALSSVRQLMSLLPVWIATWLHRAGAWEQLDLPD